MAVLNLKITRIHSYNEKAYLFKVKNVWIKQHQSLIIMRSVIRNLLIKICRKTKI